MEDIGQALEAVVEEEHQSRLFEDFPKRGQKVWQCGAVGFDGHLQAGKAGNPQHVAVMLKSGRVEVKEHMGSQMPYDVRAVLQEDLPEDLRAAHLQGMVRQGAANGIQSSVVTGRPAKANS